MGELAALVLLPLFLCGDSETKIKERIIHLGRGRTVRTNGADEHDVIKRTLLVTPTHEKYEGRAETAFCCATPW